MISFRKRKTEYDKTSLISNAMIHLSKLTNLKFWDQDRQNLHKCKHAVFTERDRSVGAKMQTKHVREDKAG
jgi:hypothetical protein